MKPTSLPFTSRADSSESHLYDDDVDRVHLISFILRQLLHKTLTNIGAIALLRAVETTLTPSSWVRLVQEDLPAAELAISEQDDGGDGSWEGVLQEEIQSSGSWDDPDSAPPPPSQGPADVLVPACKWLDSSDIAQAPVVRDLECGALPFLWFAVPNSSVTVGDPCCQEKLLWGDGLLLVLYATLAMW